MSRGLILVLFAALAIACGGGNQGLVIAVVDHQYALSQCGHGQAAQEQLRAQFEERHRALDQRGQELATLREELERQRTSGGDVAAGEERYAHEHVRLQADAAAFHAEVAQADQTVGAGIAERFSALLQDLARERAIDVVLDRGLISVASGRVADLTEDAVRIYNERYPGAAPPPAAPEAPAAPPAPAAPAAPAAPEPVAAPAAPPAAATPEAPAAPTAPARRPRH